MLSYILLHPFKTIISYKTYRVIEKTTSFLHMEFIRDIFSRIIDIIKPDLIHYHGTALSAMHFANLAKHIPVLYSPHAMVWIDKDFNETNRQNVIESTRLNLSFANHYKQLSKFE